MDYKQKNLDTYERFVDHFDEKFERNFRMHVVPSAELFISQLKGDRILDAGSGPGNHALFFKQHGLDVFAIDLSPKMIERCVSRGIRAEVHDLETLNLSGMMFDGIWMYASLLHIPHAKVRYVLDRVSSYLVRGGIFALSVKEGRGQSIEGSENIPESERMFTYFTRNEIDEYFAHYEQIEYRERKINQKIKFMNFMFRKI